MNERDQMDAEEREERVRDAAEDMLAALKTLVDDIDRGTPVELRTLPKWNAARAAIAKAEGRDP